ncbi:hypothetical protein M9H77_14404 [Catharanthus roseus]|uniref:Uncharacterized protein n=1 Tax=Catharanthus roseus TaxID=4058 RepID=A0ACC0BN47_CATRO|nr:hypothetical protein M9H77_14404 [Catharanthus roseus]
MADDFVKVSLYMLQFRAKLMHCHALQINGGLFDDIEYDIELQCNSCGETWKTLMKDPCLDVEQWFHLMENINNDSEDDFEEQKWCRRCKEAYWVRMIGGVGAALGEFPGDHQVIMNSSSWGKMMQFECSNCTISSFKYVQGWKWQVQLDDGDVVQNIDLSSGYWTQELDSDNNDDKVEEEDIDGVAEISNFSLFLHKITTN